MVRDVSHIEVQNYGMACQPSQNRQPPCKVLTLSGPGFSEHPQAEGGLN